MSRGKVTKPYSNARRTTFFDPLSVQQPSMQGGGLASLTEPFG